MNAIKVGDRVRITVPPWMNSAVREWVGRVVAFDDFGRISIDTGTGIFHPAFVEIRVIPSHRADVQIDPLEGLPHDWRRIHAREGERAVAHPLVRDAMVEYARNMRFDPENGLPAYGLEKVAQYAAQVARAQALGIDPDELTDPKPLSPAFAPVSARAHVNGGRS